jgi:predicted MFS family arabinose efflux permease
MEAAISESTSYSSSSPKLSKHLRPDISLWPAFGLGLAVAVGNGIARFAYALILPAMREDLAWTYAQAGWINTANALGYLAGAVSGYLLLMRLSPALLFSSGLYITILALIGTVGSANLTWLTSVRLAAGIGASWVFSCGSALISDRYRLHPELGGIAIGLFFGGAGLGIALSGVAVPPLLTFLGAKAWPHAWLILGLMSALLAIWPLHEASQPSEFKNASKGGSGLAMKGLWTPLLTYFCFGAGYIVYMTFVFAWMRIQGSAWYFGMAVWLVLGVALIISPFIWRSALNRWSPDLVLSTGCVVILAGVAIVVINQSSFAFLLSAAIFGLGMNVTPSAISILVRQNMPMNQWAKGMTFFTMIFALGQSIGPVAAGAIADISALEQSLLFGIALLVIATALPIASIALQKRKKS